MAISIILNQAQVVVPPDVLLVSQVENGTGNLHTLEVIILMVYKKIFDLGSYPGGSDDDGISWFVGGNIYRNGSTSTYSGKTYAVGDCIGTALDLDNGTLVYYKNGVSQGVAASGFNWYMVPIFWFFKCFCCFLYKQLRTKTLQVPTTRWFPTIEPC